MDRKPPNIDFQKSRPEATEEIMNFFEKVIFCIRMFAKGYRIRKLKLPVSKPDANGNYFDFEQH